MAAASRPATDRRTVLLDAALHVIGTRGLREATHRAVETEAGVPHGSVTYYFGSREGMLAAAVERMRELDEGRVAAMAQQLVVALASSGAAAVIGAVAEAAAVMFEDSRVAMQARYELLLTGSRDAAIGELMHRCTEVFWDLAKPVVVAAGSQDPDADARIIMAMADGLYFDALTKGEYDPALLRRGLRQALRSVAGPASAGTA
jgi:DNA-binding transcriptional regulator YbjK